MTKDVVNVGVTLDYSAKRDAVHFALAPVTCEEELKPGTHVGFIYPNVVSWRAEKMIGIVDPFLTRNVKDGDRFYLFLYPNTITGMRHEWTHPDFIRGEGHPSMSESQKWLREFADKVDADYEHMMWVAETHCEDSHSTWGEYLIEGGKWEGQSTPDEFWHHFTIVTGKSPKISKYGDTEYKPGIFSCSC